MYPVEWLATHRPSLAEEASATTMEKHSVMEVDTKTGLKVTTMQTEIAMTCAIQKAQKARFLRMMVESKTFNHRKPMVTIKTSMEPMEKLWGLGTKVALAAVETSNRIVSRARSRIATHSSITSLRSARLSFLLLSQI